MEGPEVGHGTIKWLSDDGKEGIIAQRGEGEGKGDIYFEEAAIYNVEKARPSLKKGQMVQFIIAEITEFGRRAGTVIPLSIFEDVEDYMKQSAREEEEADL